MNSSKNASFLGQPLSNPVEAYALRNAIDTQAPWYEQALQVMGSPTSALMGTIAADRSFAAMDRNEAILEQLREAGLPVVTDRYGNYISPNDSKGLLASLGRSMGFGWGNSGGNNGLLGAYYGGYVTDGSGNPVRGSNGFVTYGAGPESVGNDAFAGEVGYDQ